MTDTSLLDDPVILESIHKASDELLRRHQNKESPKVTGRKTRLEQSQADLAYPFHERRV